MKLPFLLRPILHASGLIACLVFASACSEKEAAATNDVRELAQVGETKVTEASFRHTWQKRRPSKDDPGTRNEIMEHLIRRTALSEAAMAGGLANDPIVIEQIQNLLVGRLRETKLKPALDALQVSEEEIARSYEQDSEKFIVPGKARVAALWLNTRGQAPLVARYSPRFKKIAADLSAAPDSIPADDGFGRMAVANSEHRSSRYKGGDLGWLEDGRPMDSFHTVVSEIASGLTEAGQVSAVINRPEGLFLVRLIERRTARPLALAEVRDRIRKDLLNERRKELQANFETELLRPIEITRFPEHLAALEELPLHEPRQPLFSPPLGSN